MGPLCLSYLSPSKQVLHSFEEEIARENAIFQSAKKETIGSTSEGSAKASITSSNGSTRVITRSITKIATSITPKQQVVNPTLQSHKIQKFCSNLPANEVDQTAFSLI